MTHPAYKYFQKFEDTIKAICIDNKIPDGVKTEILSAVDNLYQKYDDYITETEEDYNSLDSELDDAKEEIEGFKNAIIINPQSLKQYNEIVDYLTTQHFPYCNSIGVQIPLF